MDAANVKRSSVLVVCAVLSAVCAGCLPVELSVSPQGEFLIPRQEGFVLLDPAKGEAKVLAAANDAEPVFAVFAPGGGEFLAISKGGSGFSVSRMGRDGKGKELFTGSNLTYARWSPDGKQVSLTRVSDQQNEAVKENLPELIVVDAGGAGKKTILPGCSMIHRWTADSASILAVQITAKVQEKDRYIGQMVLVGAADGKTKPVCSVVSEKKMFLDLSPDGKKALIVATKLGKADEKLTAGEEKPKLFEVTMADGSFRVVRDEAVYALYSPKGGQVLVATAGEDGLLTLEVTDSAFVQKTKVAGDAAKSAGDGPDSADIYPGWVNDKTVHYLRRRAVFGVAGKNLQLVTVGADGKGVRNLQPVIGAALKE